METWRLGGFETYRLGDLASWRLGDLETWRRLVKIKYGSIWRLEGSVLECPGLRARTFGYQKGAAGGAGDHWARLGRAQEALGSSNVAAGVARGQWDGSGRPQNAILA